MHLCEFERLGLVCSLLVRRYTRKTCFVRNAPQWTPIPRGLPWQNSGLIRSILLRAFRTTFSQWHQVASHAIDPPISTATTTRWISIRCLAYCFFFLVSFFFLFSLSLSLSLSLSVSYSFESNDTHDIYIYAVKLSLYRSNKRLDKLRFISWKNQFQFLQSNSDSCSRSYKLQCKYALAFLRTFS